MTREEAIDYFKRSYANGNTDDERHHNEVLDMAIKALEQEPKTGHWIEGQTNNPNIHNILCSCCFEGYPSKGHANSQYTREKFKYCPNCGSKMIKPQESERIDCKVTKCENCRNHNYCDFEPQESEDNE